MHSLATSSTAFELAQSETVDAPASGQPLRRLACSASPRRGLSSAALVMAWASLCCMLSLQLRAQLLEPSSTKELTLECRDGRTGALKAGCPLVATMYHYANSGGHFHNRNRPESKVGTSSSGPFSNSVTVTTGAGGTASVWIQSTAIGQAEAIGVCADSCRYWAYLVGYDNLTYVPPVSGVWIHAGGYTTNHGGNYYNHWMTASASAGLLEAAQNFLATYPEQGKIAVNDMSLPYGAFPI